MSYAYVEAMHVITDQLLEEDINHHSGQSGHKEDEFSQPLFENSTVSAIQALFFFRLYSSTTCHPRLSLNYSYYLRSCFLLLIYCQNLFTCLSQFLLKHFQMSMFWNTTIVRIVILYSTIHKTSAQIHFATASQYQLGLGWFR